MVWSVSATFIVCETKRQEETEEVRKYYSGLPITSIAVVLPLVFVLAALCVKPQPLAARGEYRCLLGLALAAPPVMLLAAL